MDELLERLDTLLKEAKDMNVQQRDSATRLRKLISLKVKLTSYQELLMEKQVMLKQLRLGLNQEIGRINHGQA